MPTNTNVSGPFRLVSSKTHSLDRAAASAMAGEHANLPHAPTERELDHKHVEELAKRIKKGCAIAFNWATVQYLGTTYRMNGQHSSNAILQCGDELPARLAVHFDVYEAEAAEGMGLLFRQFDSRISSRSRQDVAGAYQGLVRELDGVNRRRGKLAIDGIGWYLRTIERVPTHSGDDLYDMILEPIYHPFIRWLDRILSIKTPEMEKAPIVGAMYATFAKSETGAQEFWAHVAKNDLPDDTDARAVLSNELCQIKEKKDPIAPAEYYAKCIKSWNAFRNGDSIRSKTLTVNTKKGLPDIAA